MKPASSSKDLRVQRTNHLLKKALFELLTERSFDDISVTDICDRAMVHRATFYKHFADKFDLADSCIENLRNEFFNVDVNIEDTNITTYYLHVLDKMLTYINEKKIQLKDLFFYNKEGYIYMMVVETLSKNVKVFLDKCMSSKCIKEESNIVPQDLQICFLATGITALAIWWLNDGAKYSKEEMLTYFHRLVISNLKIKEI